MIPINASGGTVPLFSAPGNPYSRPMPSGGGGGGAGSPWWAGTSTYGRYGLHMANPELAAMEGVGGYPGMGGMGGMAANYLLPQSPRSAAEAIAGPRMPTSNPFQQPLAASYLAGGAGAGAGAGSGFQDEYNPNAEQANSLNSRAAALESAAATAHNPAAVKSSAAALRQQAQTLSGQTPGEYLARPMADGNLPYGSGHMENREGRWVPVPDAAPQSAASRAVDAQTGAVTEGTRQATGNYNMMMGAPPAAGQPQSFAQQIAGGQIAGMNNANKFYPQIANANIGLINSQAGVNNARAKNPGAFAPPQKQDWHGQMIDVLTKNKVPMNQWPQFLQQSSGRGDWQLIAGKDGGEPYKINTRTGHALPAMTDVNGSPPVIDQQQVTRPRVPAGVDLPSGVVDNNDGTYTRGKKTFVYDPKTHGLVAIPAEQAAQ